MKNIDNINIGDVIKVKSEFLLIIDTVENFLNLTGFSCLKDNGLNVILLESDYYTISEHIPKEKIFELIDRAMPMKLIKHKFVNDEGKNLIQKKCPNNHSFVGRANYCSRCGQALDWSDRDE